MTLNNLAGKLYSALLSSEIKGKSEKAILIFAIGSFVIHLLVIGLVNLGIITILEPSDLLKNPISAIYTPFSFILVYEVYLLIYYLPKSTAIYVSKQYEIITLIIFRRLFKDLSVLNLSVNWFDNKNDLLFTFDLITAIILFYLIYLYHIHRRKLNEKNLSDQLGMAQINRFIHIKKGIALMLVPMLVVVSVYSFYHWLMDVLYPGNPGALNFKNINNIFFEQFFAILIITDVFLLLFSFFHTDKFHRVIRNSGFIISTILLRISFSVDGIINNLLIITAVLFGLLVIIIHNQYERQQVEAE
jgi:hypothetical protein